MKVKTINPKYIVSNIKYIRTGRHLYTLNDYKFSLGVSKNNHDILNMMKFDGHEPECICCKQKIVFLLDTSTNAKYPHYNLRMADGTPVTVDHDLLKSLDGANVRSNYNLMCASCNHERSSFFATLADFIEFKKHNKAKPTKNDVNFCYVDMKSNVSATTVLFDKIPYETVMKFDNNTLESVFHKLHPTIKQKLLSEFSLNYFEKVLNKNNTTSVMFHACKHPEKYLNVKLPDFMKKKKSLVKCKEDIISQQHKVIAEIKKMKPTFGMKVQYLMHKTKQILSEK